MAFPLAGAEATALALPRAVGDAVYIGAPFLLGLVADASGAGRGVECAVAGFAGAAGSFAPSMAFHGFPWPAMACHGLPWLAMACHDLP